ncbi:innexin inx2-like [Eriocheir sinensis]|uniref:innexin inx2-like n=1 Tax=Eriocheir sinensis TaxID=95602 RepID=UPI0021C7AFE1|nr:innexin inx2-like [Eriocheir sinensis]XP_050707946.1 innexin inx2-like [Eriocheir sinensis]
MHYTIESIRNLLAIKNIKIDNIFFFFHYKVTMVLLVIFSLLLSKKHYFGDPIDCLVESLNSHTIDMYCWIHSTYTFPALNGARVGEEVAHPGVANYEGMRRPGADPELYSVRHHKYYQWVVLFLSLQAFMFYVPRYMWKTWEGGRVGRLVGELNLPVGDSDSRHQTLTLAVDYFTRYFHYHNIYAFQFFFCELLNFINIIGQFFLTDRFLDYSFMNYGPRVTSYGWSNALYGDDPKDEIFPKVAKCVFHKFGPTGTVMRHDALCVLSLNILNEKVFAFLWYWFIALAVFTAIGLLYRLATLQLSFRTYLLRRHARLVPGEKIEQISRRCYIGDWFILCLLAQNMDAFAYRDFMMQLSERVVEKEHVS